MAAQKHILFRGPVQGEAGEEWDDSYLGIHQIIVVYGDDAIHSIHIQYDNRGSPYWVVRGEGSTGNEIGKICLNYPREILTKISGYSDDTCLRSLTFESNEKKYGPYGTPRGTSFTSPNDTDDTWKIVGFYGRSDSCFYRMGVSLSYFPKSLRLTLFGDGLEGKAGEEWDDVYSGIRQIIVVYGEDGINSMHILYDNNGSPFWVQYGRGGTGNTIGKIRLNYPREILTKISGYSDDTCLRSLTFESNEKKYGPYGTSRGSPFQSVSGSWKIVGFYGRSDSCLYRMGVSLSYFPKSLKPISVGPWGDGEQNWDDGVYSGIHQIIIVYGDDAIHSFDIEYDNNGSPLWLEHGRSTGNRIEKIQLDYPREILTSISGHYDTYLRSLRSLTFKSNVNKNLYGPYGVQQGDSFSFPISNGKIVGFHGRSTHEHLSGIGVYLSNLHTAPSKSLKPVSVGPWGNQDGEMWDDGVHPVIRKIIVVYGDDGIHSINMPLPLRRGSPGRRGGESPARRRITGEVMITGEIQLDHPSEILTKISGRYDTHLRSVTFQTNLRPVTYGRGQGNTFEFHSDGKIVGFHGRRRNEYVVSIGVYLSN